MDTPRRHTFLTLDALRGVAALAVVVFHAPQYFGGWGLPTAHLAVDFFFCLSGFVLAHAYSKKLTTGQLSTYSFMRMRLFRLYPLYILGTSITLLTALVLIPAGAAVWSPLALVGKAPSALLMLPSPSLDKNGYLYPFNVHHGRYFLSCLRTSYTHDSRHNYRTPAPGGRCWLPLAQLSSVKQLHWAPPMWVHNGVPLSSAYLEYCFRFLLVSRFSIFIHIGLSAAAGIATLAFVSRCCLYCCSRQSRAQHSRPTTSCALFLLFFR